MKLRTLISPLALAAALAFSGSAMAQTMIGDVDVSSDIAAFQEKCAALQAEANTSAAPSEDDSNDTSNDDSAQDSSADPAASANVQALLGSLTLEQCKEAAIIPGDGAALDGAVVTDAPAMDVAQTDFAADDPVVIEGCAAIRADANTSTASSEDDANDTSNDDSAQDTGADPSSEAALPPQGLNAEACTALGL